MIDPTPSGNAQNRAEANATPVPSVGAADVPAVDPAPEPEAGTTGTAPAAPSTRVGRLLGRHRLLVAIAAGVVVLLAAAGITYALVDSVEPGFDHPEAISALLAERGAPCDDYSNDGDGLADKRGVCYVNGEKIIIATFGSRDEVEAHWERQVSIAADNVTVGMVIGDKWTISGDARTYLKHAAEVLEAEYRNN